MSSFDPPSMLCPRCGTPLALVAAAIDAPTIEHATVAMSRRALELSERLQHFQPGATIPAYVLVRTASDLSLDHVLLVWPEHHRSMLTPEDWANVPPLLQQLHRCIPLVRLY